MKAKRFFFNGLILAGSLLLVLGLLEAYFRIFNPQPARPAMYTTDPIYGLKMTPGLKGYLKEAEYSHPFRLNSLGFRDKERKKEKGKNTFRIIGLGDSFTWGAGVKREETFLRKLENAINSDSGDIFYEVFNWGVSAWGTAQEFLCLKHQVLEYSPDLLILQYFTGNDLDNNIYTGLFSLDEKEQLIRSNNGQQRIKQIKNITDYFPFYRALTQHSHFINFIRIRLLASVDASDTQRLNTTLPSDRIKYGIKLTENLLEAFFSIALNHGIKIIMLAIPEQNEMHVSSMQEFSDSQKRIEKELRMIEDVCKKNKVDLLDFTKIFAKDDIPKIYYELDGHLTPYGHEVVAESILLFLNRNPLLLGAQ